MVAYSFQKQFVSPILERTKLQTVRADRRRHARPGEDLQLFTGMRTQQCKLIARVRCRAIEPIRLLLNVDPKRVASVQIAGPKQRAPEENEFARADGFTDWTALVAFWAQHHPGVECFEGVMITWEWPQ